MTPEQTKMMAAKGGACKTCRGKGTITAKDGKQIRCIDCGGKGLIGYRTK